MKQAIFTCLIFLLLSFSSSAQSISGTVNDADGKPLANATVSLLQARDSAVAKLGVTDKEGHYTFKNARQGSYLISSSFVGFEISYSAVFAVNATGETTVPALTLSKPSSKLKEVVVAYKKPLIEVRADKTILNVENSINAVGQDAMDLLRKSPGVLVDKDDNLSLSGKNGVQVYIDGRPSPLTGKDLSDYLKSIQSSQIEAIEIITNPSAKYDAAGNAGIINIRLKKNKSYGTNGSANAGYTISTYAKYNAGLNLNYRNKKVNLFGNYNYNQGLNESLFNLYREQLDTLFDQRTVNLADNKTHGFKAGADYYIDRKNTIGVLVNGNLNNGGFTSNSRTPITYIPDNALVKILEAKNTTSSTRNNMNYNINYRFADTSGHELNMDADYGTYRIKSNQLQPNYYYDASGTNLTDSYIYNFIAPTNIDIYTFKTDYEQNLEKGRLGIGAKISYVKSLNNFDRYNVYQTGKVKDTLRSNDFNYKENINAVYVNYNRQFKGFMVQAGVRIENTHAKGVSNGYKWTGSYETYDSTFDRNYTDFFPSAAITFNKNPMSQFSFSYSRRIDRPAYQDLNPFEFKLDEYTFQKGNTQLRPQYTNSFAVTHSYKYFLTTTLNYSHVKDVFTQLIDTAEKSKTFITKKNLATQDIVSLNISAPLNFKWYSAFINVNTYYTHYKANLGTGRTIDLDAYALSLYAQNTFNLGKGYTAELSGFFSTPSIWEGTFKTRAFGGFDIGAQKTVLKGQGTLKASLTDVLLTERWYGTSNFAGQYIRTNGGWESRGFRLFFTYRFGSNQVKAARQRSTGLDDESKRVGSQGGGVRSN